jgi:hypothetical protein
MSGSLKEMPGYIMNDVITNPYYYPRNFMAMAKSQAWADFTRGGRGCSILYSHVLGYWAFLAFLFFCFFGFLVFWFFGFLVFLMD